MIDDLITEIVVGAVDRLLSPETPREEAEFALARVNARLSPARRREKMKLDQAPSEGLDPELEPRLLTNYLQLGVDDLQEISPRVHEWLLERLSHAPAALNAPAAATLRRLYFLFPETTVRHAVIGLLIQADREGEGRPLRPPGAAISDAIDEDAGMSSVDRTEGIRLLVDLLLDYVDVFPDETERALAALNERHRKDTLRAYLLDWSSRLGGEAGIRVRRALEHTTGKRE